MITCRELADALPDLVTDELPPTQRAVIAQHLDACPPCVDLLEEYRLTMRLARQRPPLPMPAELVARLQATVASQRQPFAQGPGAP